MTAIYAKAIAALLLVAAIVGGWHWVTHHYYEQGYQVAKAEDKAAAEAQAERNRDLQRQAEKRYVVEQGVRDRYLVTTVREVHEASAALAGCPVPDAVRVRLRAAIECARDDSGAACSSGEPVPAAR